MYRRVIQLVLRAFDCLMRTRYVSGKFFSYDCTLPSLRPRGHHGLVASFPGYDRLCVSGPSLFFRRVLCGQQCSIVCCESVVFESPFFSQVSTQEARLLLIVFDVCFVDIGPSAGIMCTCGLTYRFERVGLVLNGRASFFPVFKYLKYIAAEVHACKGSSST